MFDLRAWLLMAALGQTQPTTPVVPIDTFSRPQASKAPIAQLEAKALLEGRAAATSLGQGELQLDPSLLVHLGRAETGLGARYQPTFLYQIAPFNTPTFLALHRAVLEGALSQGAEWVVSLGERLFYGQTSFSWFVQQAQNPLPSFDLLPTDLPFRLAQLDTNLRAEKRLSRHFRLGASGAFVIGGGDFAPLNGALPPLQRTLRGSLDLDWSDRRESAHLTLGAGRILLLAGAGIEHLLFGYGSYEHRFSRRVAVSLSAGVERGYGDVTPTFFPIFSLGLDRLPVRVHREPKISVHLREVPTQDVQTGRAIQRPQLVGLVEQPVSRKVVLVGAAGAALLSNEISATNFRQALFQGSLGARGVIGKNFQISGGLRAVRQQGTTVVVMSSGTLGQSTQPSWALVAYLGLGADTQAAF